MLENFTCSFFFALYFLFTPLGFVRSYGKKKKRIAIYVFLDVLIDFWRTFVRWFHRRVLVLKTHPLLYFLFFARAVSSKRSSSWSLRFRFRCLVNVSKRSGSSENKLNPPLMLQGHSFLVVICVLQTFFFGEILLDFCGAWPKDFLRCVCLSKDLSFVNEPFQSPKVHFVFLANNQYEILRSCTLFFCHFFWFLIQ